MEKLILIKTQAELKELEAYLQDKEFVAFDTETTGVGADAQIIGFSVSAETDSGYYVILKAWVSDKLVDVVPKEACQNLIESLNQKQLIMHNSTFDCFMVQNNFGVNLMPAVHTDTMILAYLLDENRPYGLKDLGVILFGDDAKAEQAVMKESVIRNGGQLTKANYELYKADADLIGRYGAKDTILTLKLFYTLVPELYEQRLDRFFYEDESMPLLRGPTYDLNTTGLRLDIEALQKLKAFLEAEIVQDQAFIDAELKPLVAAKYPGTTKATTFNIGSGPQLAWLLFERLGQPFDLLTAEGKNVCKALGMKLPYSHKAKREFVQVVRESLGRYWIPDVTDPITGEVIKRGKKVKDPWCYMATGKETLEKFPQYKWAKRYSEMKKKQKLLSTYVEGILEKQRYGVIRPSFLQNGTTSGRYSSRNPNFQNLPRDDKRLKDCIIARPGKVFVGADYSQLEPRVFASFSGDERLLACFKNEDDFYSVVGTEIFDRQDCGIKKGAPDFFRDKYPTEGHQSKVIALAAVYGATAPRLSPVMKCSIDEAQKHIDNYFKSFPSVAQFMLNCHSKAKSEGQVVSLFGRPRRLPKALEISKIYGKTKHSELPSDVRGILNLSVNHTIQSTGASIMNRAAIAVKDIVNRLAEEDPSWNEVKIVMQVHDELILEGPEELQDLMSTLLKECMENTIELPGVALVANPVIAKRLSDLK